MSAWLVSLVWAVLFSYSNICLLTRRDPTTGFLHHTTQVRELCAYVEKAHGMSQGWLLSASQARVSEQKTVANCPPGTPALP